MPPRLGILGLQGDFAAHARIADALGWEHELVRESGQLSGLSLLAMPGGESTTMSLLLDTTGLREPLRQVLASKEQGGAGLPVLATCAGVILLARELLNDSGSLKVTQLGLLDAVADRNSYGRQVQSFEAELDVDWAALGRPDFSGPLHGVFIRAPRLSGCGAGVCVACEHAGLPVLVRQGNILAATFHPELAGDTRLHEAAISL